MPSRIRTRIPRRFLAAAALGILLASCRLTGEERAFLDVKADSTWTEFDEIAVILSGGGREPDTLFRGKLSSPSQLGKLPAPGYDGGVAQVILIGFRDGQPVKSETRYYDGRTQAETGPKLVVNLTADPRKAPVVRLGSDSVVSVNVPVRIRGTVSDSDGTIAKLEWSIGGGPFLPGSGDTAFTPIAIGSLACILRATDNDGLTSADTLNLNIAASPPPSLAAFAPSDTTISIRDSLVFTARATGTSPLANFSWDFDGDGLVDETGTLLGTTASLKSGKRFPTAGIYTVTLKVTDQVGGYQFKQGRVSVETDPPTAKAGNDTAVGAGTRVNLHGAAADRLGKVAKTEWKIGTGAYSPAPPETSFTAPEPGGFVLVCALRVTDDDGMTDSDQVLVNVNPSEDQTPPDPPKVKGPGNSANPMPTWTWESSGGGDGTFRYELDDADFATGATQTTALSYTPTSALPDGYHTLYVRERDANGNWSAFGAWRIAVAVGPVSRFNFDGDFKDSGPSANHGTASGTVSFVADRQGAPNKAVSFQAGNGSVSLRGAGIPPGSAITVTAWILERDSAASRAILSPGESGVGFRMLSQNAAIAVTVSPDSGNAAHCPISLGQWTHIACTYDGASLRIYKNGFLQETAAGPVLPWYWGLEPGEIGSEGQTFWKGSLDDLRIYNRVLSATDIAAIYSGTL
jgi:hypothetical protein